MKKTTRQPTFSEEDFYQIISKGIPSPQQVLDELNDFTSILYDAFDDANSKIAEFLKANAIKKRTEIWVAPALARFFVHNYLDLEGIKAQLVNENDEIEDSGESEVITWEQKVLSNNGIAGIIKGYNYRILKALNGDTPPPNSGPKRVFYNQPHLKAYQPLLIPSDNTAKSKILLPNIIFLWELVDHKYIQLYLSIPKYANKYGYSTETQRIPHPATTIKRESDEVFDEAQTKNTIIRMKNKNNEGMKGK